MNKFYYELYFEENDKRYFLVHSLKRKMSLKDDLIIAEFINKKLNTLNGELSEVDNEDIDKISGIFDYKNKKCINWGGIKMGETREINGQEVTIYNSEEEFNEDNAEYLETTK